MEEQKPAMRQFKAKAPGKRRGAKKDQPKSRLKRADGSLVSPAKMEIASDDEDVKPARDEDDPLAPVRLERGARRPTQQPRHDDLDMFLVQLPTSLPPSLPRRPKPGNDEDFQDLAQLEPGPIGKLQVLRSGKKRLLLGDQTFDVDRGLHCSMLQQLVAVHDSSLVVVGDVYQKLLVTTRPDPDSWHDDDDDDDDG
mmetsp:Transcript_21289/g.65704  ORF Transcript_21289/g.65704 Transcript_21289/m.65704 type:complete len:196 (-) Transcript_21289:1167-1754(-)